MEMCRNEDYHFVLSTPSLVCKLPSNPPLAAFFLWGKKPKLFNLLWNETFCAFAGCTQEELISLSSKSSFVWFSLIHFLRCRQALTLAGREPQEFPLAYLEFHLFLPKVWNIELNMKDYGFRFCKTFPDLMIPQDFSVDFAAGSMSSRMGSNTQITPKVSMCSWMWWFYMNPGKLEKRESGGVEPGNHSANTHLVLLLQLESFFSFLCSRSWLGEGFPWRENAGKKPEPLSWELWRTWILEKNHLTIFPFLPAFVEVCSKQPQNAADLLQVLGMDSCPLHAGKRATKCTKTHFKPSQSPNSFIPITFPGAA